MKTTPVQIRKQLVDKIKEVVQHQNCVAADAIKEAERQLNYARRVSRIRGTKWVDIDGIELEIGRVYIVRRVYGKYWRRQWSSRNPECEPAIAIWESWGWRVVLGNIPDGCVSSTIEVWQ